MNKADTGLLSEVIAMAMRRTVDGESLIETIERCLLETMHGEGFTQCEMAKILCMPPRVVNDRLRKLMLRPKDIKLKSQLIAEQGRRVAVVA